MIKLGKHTYHVVASVPTYTLQVFLFPERHEPNMRVLLTGAAGFLANATVQLLCREGHTVDGIDSLTDYYEPAIKLANLTQLEPLPGFTFTKRDLLTDDVDDLFENADAVIHLAGQPGVRHSWIDFSSYVKANIEATQTVLNLSHRHGVDRVVYASSSSVYGNPDTFPSHEADIPSPASPYAISKLAGEQLCTLFAQEHAVSTVSLRYFTVYGPRQRPDMLTHRLIDAASGGPTVSVFGDGEKIRDFTYVGDIARANLAAATADVSPGSIYNIAGGSAISVNQMIDAVEYATGRRVDRAKAPASIGDVDRTGGDTTRAQRELAWEPQVDLADGLAVQVQTMMTDRALSIPADCSAEAVLREAIA